MKSKQHVGWLVYIAEFLLSRPKKVLLTMAIILIFGLVSWLSLLPREGFPPVSQPIVFIDVRAGGLTPQQADELLAQPVYEQVNDVSNISSIDSVSFQDGSRTIVITEEGVDTAEEVKLVEEALTEAGLPETAEITVSSINPGKIDGVHDILIAVSNATGIPSELNREAEQLVEGIVDLSEVESAKVLPQIAPLPSGDTVQISFAKYANDENGVIERTDEALLVGIVASEGVDVDSLSGAVNNYVDEYTTLYTDSTVAVAADFAPFIDQQINSLLNNLGSGLLAVIVVTLLFISWRASFITALFIISVVVATMGVLYLIGYTINVISLFAIVLALGLFVDDATIVVEAAERESRKKKTKRVDFAAVRKIAMASFAGTLTTVLVFLPLAFVGGILGSFIRVMPVTLSIALFLSLFISLFVTPIGLRKIFAKSHKRGFIVGWVNKSLDWLADKITHNYKLLGQRKTTGVIVASLSVLFSLGLIAFGGMRFGSLPFDIFPAAKDGNQLTVQVDFINTPDVDAALATMEEIDRAVFSDPIISENTTSLLYFDGSARSVNGQVNLTTYQSRDISAVEIAQRMESAVQSANIAASYRANVQAGGPPVEEYPFKMQIYSDDIELAREAGQTVADFIEGQTVTTQSGNVATITEARLAPESTVTRSEGRKFVEVEASFDSNEVTSLVLATQELIEERFDATAIEAFGLSSDTFGFDFGQESQNQESFSSLMIVGPLAVLAMYILLSLQFRSMLQPLLIFLAIPFSIFGVAYGLYLTDNGVSFFSMLGFLGLIGIAVNNTILLVDYANQERRAGANAIDAITTATKLRLRPLLATTITTVSALLPLAISDPFWQALAIVIIFGLISSTLLVIVAFPYYYILVYWLRQKLQRK